MIRPITSPKALPKVFIGDLPTTFRDNILHKMQAASFLSALLCLVCSTRCLSAVPCMYNRAVLKDGRSFLLDSCTTCTCQDGTVDCVAQACPELHCQYYEDPGFFDEGDCCPICIARPVVEPPIYNPRASSCHGEGYFTLPSDPCLNCSCQSGHMACMDILCPEIHCPGGQIPQTVEGKCCLVCPVVQQTSPSSQHTCNSDPMRPFREGCNRCRCIDGEKECRFDETLCPHAKVSIQRCIEGSVANDGCKKCICKKGTLSCTHDPTLCSPSGSQDRDTLGMMIKVSDDRKPLTELQEVETKELAEEVNHILGEEAVLAVEKSPLNEQKNEFKLFVKYRDDLANNEN